MHALSLKQKIKTIVSKPRKHLESEKLTNKEKDG